MAKKIMGTGLTREEIMEYSDNMRESISNYIADHGKVTITELATKFEVSRDQIRCYIKYLVTAKNVYSTMVDKTLYYSPTGLPYAKTYPPDPSGQGIKPNPHARTIRLMDKHRPKPAEGERKLNPYRSTSMAMFETS